MPNRQENFEDRAANLNDHATRWSSTGLLVAKCGPSKNKKTVEGLIDAATQVKNMTPQVVSAGKIRLHNDTDYANQHFDNLKREYSDALNRLRSFVDDAIDTGDFVRASETVSKKN